MLKVAPVRLLAVYLAGGRNEVIRQPTLQGGDDGAGIDINTGTTSSSGSGCNAVVIVMIMRVG